MQARVGRPAEPNYLQLGCVSPIALYLLTPSGHWHFESQEFVLLAEVTLMLFVIAEQKGILSVDVRSQQSFTVIACRACL